MRKLKILQKLPNMTQRYEVSKCYYKNGSDRYDLSRVTTNLKFVEKRIIICKEK